MNIEVERLIQVIIIHAPWYSDYELEGNTWEELIELHSEVTGCVYVG